MKSFVASKIVLNSEQSIVISAGQKKLKEYTIEILCVQLIQLFIENS